MATRSRIPDETVVLDGGNQDTLAFHEDMYGHQGFDANIRDWQWKPEAFGHVGEVHLGQWLGQGGFGVAHEGEFHAEGQMQHGVVKIVSQGNPLREVHGCSLMNHMKNLIAESGTQCPVAFCRTVGTAWVETTLTGNPDDVDRYLAICQEKAPGRSLMEFDGPAIIQEDLRAFDGTPLYRPPQFTLNQTLSILADLADAVDVMHAFDISHGDIKPANIMIDTSRSQERPQVHLIDYSLVEWMTPSLGRPRMGTPAYMAISMESHPPCQDRYAVASMAVELLTGTKLHEYPINKISLDNKGYLRNHEIPIGIAEESFPKSLSEPLIELLQYQGSDMKKLSSVLRGMIKHTRVSV